LDGNWSSDREESKSINLESTPEKIRPINEKEDKSLSQQKANRFDNTITEVIEDDDSIEIDQIQMEIQNLDKTERIRRSSKL
jgi:hypothetical protein